MLIYNYSMNFNGASQINDKQVMTVSASHDGGQLYITESIIDIDVYLANKETIDSDYNEFKTKVLESITSGTEDEETTINN